MFQYMMNRIQEEVTEYLFKIRIEKEAELPPDDGFKRQPKMVEHRGGSEEESKPVTVRRDENKVGRNEPCPCGSGKKYKKCHGK